LQRLNLDAKFLRGDLSEVWKRGGWVGLRHHLIQLEQGEDVFTGKLMLVGNGKVGKSCLLDALRGFTPRHERDTTHGMVREQLHLRMDGSLMDDAERRQLKGARLDVIDFQCWDMGGQEAYWTTHQMFFTPEALYLMAYHGREGIARGQVREWMTLIRNRATGRARVILVATHCRKENGVTAPDLSSLDEEMRAMIVGFVAVDSFEPHGIKELLRQLAIQAQLNDYFKRRMLGRWTKFQTALSNVKMPFVGLASIIKVSEKSGLSRNAVMQLLQLANDVGILLWHHQSEELSRFVVLHPDWLSQAVAYVLKYEPAKRSSGIISHHELSQLWAAPPYPESQPYPTNVHSMLVALMEETEISYRLPLRTATRNRAEMSLIAQLVDRNPPLTWQSRWEVPIRGIHTEMVRLFSFLPPQGRKLQRLTGLVYRLIVRLHEYSLGRRDYTQAVHWQNGLLLSNDYGDLARIEFRDDDELEIRVRGLIPVSFMDRLRDTLKEVVDDFWKGVTVREMTFCADHCPSGIKTGAFDVDLCRSELIEGETMTRCSVQACRKKVPILSLLSPPVESVEVNTLRRLLEDRFNSLDEQVAMVQKTVTAVGAQMTAFQQILRDDIRSVMATLMDSGHDGPRLFSVKLLEPGFLDNPNWASTKLQVTLWCEHSHLPLCFLSAKSKTEGVYHIDVQKEWLIKAGKCLKFASRLVLYVKTLGLAGGLSDVSVDVKNSVLEDAETMHKIADILKPEESSLVRLDNMITSAETLPEQDTQTLEDHGKLLEKGDAFAHWLRVQIKAKDPHFAGMKKVTDITGKVLWVHQKYLEHYQKPTPRME
jgi:GTPase SAR1 family protein